MEDDLDVDHEFLFKQQKQAATPKDIINNPTTPDPLGIAEYKNPYKFISSMLLEAATQDKAFLWKVMISLKQTHA